MLPWKTLISVGAAISLAAPLTIVGIGAVSHVQELQSDPCLQGGAYISPVPVTINLSGIIGDAGLEMTQERANNAAILIGTAATKVEEYDLVVDDFIMLLMTGLRESTLINHPHLGSKNDHESLGILQMQTGVDFGPPDNQYWGTPQQLMDPSYQAARYLREMHEKVPAPGRYEIAKTLAINRAQNSGHPYGYAQWEDEARIILGAAVIHTPADTGEEQPDDSVPDTSVPNGSVPPPSPAVNAITFIGDSLTVGTNAYMFSDLAAAGFTEIRVNAQGARSVEIDADFLVPTTSITGPELTAEEQPLRSGLQAIGRELEFGHNPTYWGILLGTNDIGMISGDPAEGTDDARRVIAAVMNTLGPDKKVLWLTVWSTGAPEKARIFNEALVRMSAEYGNMLVADWASLASQNPDWMVDRVHYNATGNRQRSTFIARASALLPGLTAGGRRFISLPNPDAGLVGLCNFTGPVGPAPEGAVAELYNPRLAAMAGSFEQIVGCDIKYGAPGGRSGGYRGNFGHGDIEQWLSEARADPQSCAIDCSGFVNALLYMTYRIRYSGCSHSYADLRLNGVQVTATVMQGGIDPRWLRPGDFIIRHNRGCPGGGDINHILVVVQVRGSLIVTAEATPGGDGGHVIRARDASWYNTDPDWSDLIVSRWIGPGAERLPGLAPPVTTTTSPAEVVP